MSITRSFFVALAAVALMAPAAAHAQAATQKPAADIMLTSKPNPPKMGPNTFDVMVKAPDGKAITDADVSATFFMAAMPAMKMPEMKNTVALKHVKDGAYSGTGNVMMAGKWDATVSVKRAGKEIASKTFPVTAQ
jgi:Cu(I)/Ag(I) efflux system membrane fusion protein/cobalt-zinc-cadmium efflux system membrane fusion protein